MCNRIRKIADRCCCTPQPPPIHPLISVRGVCSSALRSAGSPVPQGTGPSAPDLPRRMNAAQRRAFTNSLKLQEVPGGLCHLQTTQGGAKSLPAVSDWRPCKDTAKAHAVSGQNSWPTTISTEPCVTVASRNTSNQNEREGDLSMLREDSSNTPHLVMLATLCFASFRHNIRH